MKITDVHVDGFGVWRDLDIGDLAPALTVFFGPNEAGKTTLMQFMRTVLYGFSAERRERYFPPVHGGRAGGSLGVVTLTGRYRIQRSGPREGRDDVGEAQLIAADGSAQRAHLLKNLLAHVDEQIFSNVFAIGLRELQELGTLDDTEAAQQLYKLTSGMDRVSLVEVMAQLDKSREEILARDSRAGQLNKLLAERERLRAEIEKHGGHSRRWAQWAAERQTLDEETQRLTGRIRELEQQSRVVEIAMQVRDRWRQRVALDQQLQAFAQAPEVSPESLRKLDRIHRVLGEREKRLESIRQQRARLRQDDESVPWNKALWEHRGRLEALTEHVTWIDALRKHLAQLQPEIDRLQAELKQASQELGISPQSLNNGSTLLSRRTLVSLRGPARAARVDHRRLKQAEADRDSAVREQEELGAQLELELHDSGHGELAAALDRAGDVAEKLRRRVQVEERIEKLNRHRKELEEDCLEYMRTPIMPVRQMVVWGTLVSFGVMLLLIALFSDLAGEHRIPVVFFGLMCSTGGFLLKHAYQQINNQELDDCQRQLGVVKKHIQQAITERDEIDAGLPQGAGPLETRLRRADDEVKKLESLAPLLDQRGILQQRQEEAERRAKQAAAALRESRQRWRAALRKLNLSEELTPQKLRQLATGHERITTIHRQLQAKRKEKDDRDLELQALAERIGQVLRDAGLNPGSDDPHHQIRQMADAVAEQDRMRELRARLRAQDRQLEKQRRRCLASSEKLRLRRQAMFSRAGVEDEREYRRLAEDQARQRKLEQERRSLDEQIRAAVGAQCDIAAVEEELAAGTDLQARWQGMAQQLRDWQGELTALHQKQGELQQKLKTLASDRQLDEARLELGCLEELIARAKRRWQVLAVTGLILESIRQVYESERQPETLNEASKYLHALTNGRYQRVWTPLGKHSLRVDDGQGKTLGVELLSQGTREAVFLSLRLALVAAYARRGVALPLVLDDVLVNLDAGRAVAAVRTLREFADQGHQILVFTCHEHIASLFRQVQADTRRLPAHASLPETPALAVSSDPVAVPIAADTGAENEAELLDEDSMPVESPPAVAEDLPANDAELLLDRLHSLADNALAELSPDAEAPAADESEEERPDIQDESQIAEELEDAIEPDEGSWRERVRFTRPPARPVAARPARAPAPRVRKRKRRRQPPAVPVVVPRRDSAAMWWERE